MDLQIKMAVEGKLDQYMAQRQKGVASAVTRAVRGVTAGLRKEIARQAKRADFKKDGLEKLIKAKVNPRRGYQPDADGVVYSVARVQRRGKEVDLFEVFDQGADIQAQGGKWLAIPTQRAPLGQGRGSSRRAASPGKLSDAQFKQMTFIPTRKPDLAMLAYKDRTTGQITVAYWLVKRISLRKRLDLKRAERKWLPRLETRINRNLDRFVYRTGVEV